MGEVQEGMEEVRDEVQEDVDGEAQDKDKEDSMGELVQGKGNKRDMAARLLQH
jgi:hypothetical protein